MSAGIEYFQNGELELARAAFEDARAAGLESNALMYNLGVVYYRLGEYELAADAFSALLETDSQALAEYNLGLVAKAAGDQGVADMWFARAAAESSPEKVRALAAIQLQETEQSLSPAYSPMPWMGYVSLAGGYDDNIASVPASGSSGREGGFGELLAAGSADVYQSGDSVFRLEGAAYSRQYPSEPEFDTDVLQFGAGWLKRLGPGRVDVTAGISQSWFDSDELERTYRLDLSYRLDQCPFTGTGSRCQASVSSGIVEGGEGFEAYDGQWYQARVKGRKDYTRWRIDAQYRWDLNAREDLEAGEQFVSVSPQRHMAELTFRFKVSRRWNLGVEGSYRHSRYADPHRLISSQGALESERRIDKRTQGSLLTEYALSTHWSVRGEWMFRDNQSSFDRYDYRRQTALVGIDGVF
ncbi:tetratricopeptide repeat protein [Marinobacter sp.]|uniref:tetratricopeptide repeat protein n=1 Tax=Marinobacter sp. TaxID=50741 RepID=UPI0034A51DA6